MKTSLSPLLLTLAVAWVACAEEPPRITLAPVDQKVASSGIVSFFCKASGNPAPEIYWRKAGRRVSHSRQRYQVVEMPRGSVLRIEPVKAEKDNDVEFECVADSGYGEPAVARATLSVYPKESGHLYGTVVTRTGHLIPVGYPEIKESPTLKAVEKERNTVMICNAQGTPEPEVFWLKDYVPVDLTDPRLHQLPTGSLSIHDSRESDEGKYECVSHNEHGVTYSFPANLYVRVRRVPPHFSIEPENHEVMPGDDLNITCVAVGSPMPYVKWRLGDIFLTPEDQIPIGRNVLKLTDVRVSQNYTCVASSDLGNIEATSQVKVKALPKPPTSLVISEVTATSVRLTWNHENEESIDTYTILFKKKYPLGGEFEEIEGISGKDYKVQNLAAHTYYDFRVSAGNNIGRGNPSSVSEVITGELDTEDDDESGGGASFWEILGEILKTLINNVTK